ncbi:fimbria/pilus outer membrane usher protein, partial [Salmonella enterica subsp. enterica serovar Montevideo]|nr:fimbria/pilus outer membrane usher protein [Salmonella enterica subsp. enterica serovar Montevideo]
GLIASTGDYQSAALGTGQNMGLLGALSADVTRSDARLPHGQKMKNVMVKISRGTSYNRANSATSASGATDDITLRNVMPSGLAT